MLKSWGELTEMVRKTFDRLTAVVVPPPENRTVRIFWARIGVDDLLTSRSLYSRALTPMGVNQAKAAGVKIRDRLQGASVVVLDCDGVPPAYHQTAQHIAAELGVEVKHVESAPLIFGQDLEFIFNQGGAIVVVMDGSNLAIKLREIPGPPVKLNEHERPVFGSVHELVITYRIGPSTWNYPEVVEQWFV